VVVAVMLAQTLEQTELGEMVAVETPQVVVEALVMALTEIAALVQMAEAVVMVL
jgi:hypothetical protein